MSAFVNRRRGSGGWITRTLADTADIRTPLDAACFIACGVLVATLGGMILFPVEFFNLVTGVFR